MPPSDVLTTGEAVEHRKLLSLLYNMRKILTHGHEYVIVISRPTLKFRKEHGVKKET
jgi:hypothetical protein